MAERKFYERISAASGMPPKDASQDWLANAEPDGVRLLTREESDFVILYASFQALLIIAVFGEASRLAAPDKDELYNSSFYTDEAWCIQKAYGGGQGHRGD